jgi:hypothetical protein
MVADVAVSATTSQIPVEMMCPNPAIEAVPETFTTLNVPLMLPSLQTFSCFGVGTPLLAPSANGPASNPAVRAVAPLIRPDGLLGWTTDCCDEQLAANNAETTPRYALLREKRNAMCPPAFEETFDAPVTGTQM